MRVKEETGERTCGWSEGERSRDSFQGQPECHGPLPRTALEFGGGRCATQSIERIQGLAFQADTIAEIFSKPRSGLGTGDNQVVEQPASERNFVIPQAQFKLRHQRIESGPKCFDDGAMNFVFAIQLVLSKHVGTHTRRGLQINVE